MVGRTSVHVGIAIAGGGAGLLAAIALRLALRRVAARASADRWRYLVADMLAYLLPWAALIAGAWTAVLSLAATGSQWRGDADKGLLALIVLAASFGAARAAAGAVRAGALEHSGFSGSATIFVNIARLGVLAIGFLILLDGLGVSITPLLTALGVGGLAVALALQDTLTNLFAGVHILASRKVQAGDFVQLDTGQEGYVVDTNWRHTAIRQLPDNLIIVPNAALASSTVINYHRPEHESSVTVQVGVAYDSDLDHVERVTCDVGRDVMRSVDGAVPGFEPTVRYHTFGDSNIGFTVALRAREVTARYLIVHEFIKRLHRRYLVEGIEIPFPVQTVIEAAGQAGHGYADGLAWPGRSGTPANRPRSARPAKWHSPHH